MKASKYKTITSKKQYDKYCKELISLVFGSEDVSEFKDDIKQLNSLIEKWETEHFIESGTIGT